ncbi:MAG TPA: RHS repeat-associated core domain-containing protein [Vicinamibacteria bacterium]|nr:RHS repeat-associated core domain-containing protein [Vicinamibacteria bacterium]
MRDLVTSMLRKRLPLLAVLLFLAPSARAQVVEYYHLDAVGNVRIVTNQTGQVVERHDYLPFGEECLTPPCTPIQGTNTRKFTGKERDAETGLDYFGARYYGSKIGRFTTVDPVLDAKGALANPQKWNRYAYVLNNPMRFIDPDGREPVRNQAGTVAGFIAEMNASRTRIGTAASPNAANALLRLGETELGRNGVEPATTRPFNGSANRYVYTEKAGWVDIVHFLFYAGVAYRAFVNGSDTPIADAVQSGYHQEAIDLVAAPWSAYSYEDLPSDREGASFAAQAFRPASGLSLGQQVQDYLLSRGATNPQSAPNWGALPLTATRNSPTARNYTTSPLHTSYD